MSLDEENQPLESVQKIVQKIESVKNLLNLLHMEMRKLMIVLRIYVIDGKFVLSTGLVCAMEDGRRGLKKDEKSNDAVQQLPR